MKVCFLTAGPIEWGSSRMRAYWVARRMGADVEHLNGVQQSPHWPLKHDVFIWQKAADTQLMETMSGRHYWDVCDPSWWFQPKECEAILGHMDGVICSSDALADDFRQWSGYDPVHTIPDRLNYDHFPLKRTHRSVSPVRFIWFGVGGNRISLYGALANMERLQANGYNIELTILDDRPDARMGVRYPFPVYYARWELDKENEIIANHDIALLPPYPGPWGQVKSDNKTLTAWACGLPVVSGFDYEAMRLLVQNDRKRSQAIPKLGTANSVEASAREWEAILCS